MIFENINLFSILGLIFLACFLTLYRGFAQDKPIAEQNGMHHWIQHALMLGEKILERKKNHYEANREKLLEKKKKYREANREKLLEKEKKYREANREKEREDQKKYYEANREKVLEKKKKKISSKDIFWWTERI